MARDQDSRSIVLGNLFTKHEDLLIGLQFLSQCLIQCISYCDFFRARWRSVSPSIGKIDG